MKKRRLDVMDYTGKVIASAELWCEDGAALCKVMNYAHWPKSITANLVDIEGQDLGDVSAEREACAQRAERYANMTGDSAGDALAEAIRRRGES